MVLPTDVLFLLYSKYKKCQGQNKTGFLPLSIMKIFLLLTKPKIDFFAQFSVQFGRRAKRGGKQEIDFFSNVDPGRFELPTFGMQNRCSTIELRAHRI